MRFSMDPTWRRPDNGDALLAGSPVRAFRVTPAGRSIIETIERGDDIVNPDNPLVAKLLDAGAIHPLPSGGTNGVVASDITAVLPVFLDDPADESRLANLVGALDGLANIIVIDDHSPLPLPTFAAGSTPVRTVRRESNGGPAAARNTGLALVDTPCVAFVDVDVVCTADDVVALGNWLVHPRTAVIAPRVRTRDDESLIGAYEAVRSPLDVGNLPGRARPGSRIPYLPTALLLCRTSAVESVDGFDESMRTGEDVDLVWRLDEAGMQCRYEPAVEVNHEPRRDLAAFARQRSGYGESTTTLRRKHGTKVAPLRTGLPNLSTWLSLIVGLPLVAACLGALTVVRLAKKLQFVPNANAESARLALTANLRTGRNLADAITKVWWPIAVVLAIFSRRARVALCAAALVPSLAEWWTKRPRLDPVRYTLMRIIDDASYGTGVWKAAWRERSLDALKPEIVSWSSSED
jgi:mycofactocin glycosyltransferase